jgi:hypothetical protein
MVEVKVKVRVKVKVKVKVMVRVRVKVKGGMAGPMQNLLAPRSRLLNSSCHV